MYIEKTKNFLKSHQQNIVLVIGYVLVAGLGFGIGLIYAQPRLMPEIRVEQVFLPPNYTVNGEGNQSKITPNSGQLPPPNPAPPAGAADCPPGAIKGNEGSGGSRVYHMPGGSFYNRTKAEACFASEAEAQAAGFRKSSS